jgi:hypothetical protein
MAVPQFRGIVIMTRRIDDDDDDDDIKCTLTCPKCDWNL